MAYRSNRFDSQTFNKARAQTLDYNQYIKACGNPSKEKKNANDFGYPGAMSIEKVSKVSDKPVYKSNGIPSDNETKGVANKILGQIKSHGAGDITELKSYLSQNPGNKTETALSNIITYSEMASPSITTLRRGSSNSWTVSSKDCAILIAKMFLCHPSKSFSSDLNRDQSFKKVFEKSSSNNKQDKIHRIFEYFLEAPSLRNKITFERKSLIRNASLRSLATSSDSLCSVSIREQGYIEEAPGIAWTDFANKYIGGGTLRDGYVQEERLFFKHPEVIVSMLSCETLDDNEALIIKSSEGYEIVAIDAMDFSKSGNSSQFTETAVEREINKALAGFSSARYSSIGTGKWGCGAFKGDVELKFLVQWIAMTLARKEMIYFAAKDYSAAQEVKSLVDKFKFKKIGDVVEYINKTFIRSEPKIGGGKVTDKYITSNQDYGAFKGSSSSFIGKSSHLSPKNNYSSPYNYKKF